MVLPQELIDQLEALVVAEVDARVGEAVSAAVVAEQDRVKAELAAIDAVEDAAVAALFQAAEPPSE